MLIDWIKLSFALVLLWVPVTVLHGKRVIYREVAREWEGHWGRTLGLGWHAFDLLRAILGAWLMASALARAPEAQGAMKYAAFAAQTAMIAVASILQTMVCRPPDCAHAPFAFVSGLVLGLMPPLVAGFALVLTLALTLGSRYAPAFFPLLAVATCAIGTFFTGRKHLYVMITAAIATGLPWLLVLLFPRNLVCSHLAKRKVTAASPPR
jgi:hypothetical protein